MNHVITIHKYDEEYIKEIHLAKVILESYGMEVVILNKKRPMHHQTMYNITCKRKLNGYLAVTLLSSLCHCKKELKK